MYLTKVSDEWIPLQAKVFTRWVSNQLKDIQGMNIQDVTKDLSSGVALCELAKVLTGKQSTRSWAHTPKHNVEMVQNCDLAVDMFTKDGVHLVGISGKDIHDNNNKLILGFIWSLILHYSVHQSVNHQVSSKDNNSTNEISNDQSAKSDRDQLLAWAIDRTANYPNIHEFTPYGLSMCALLDSYVPNKINYYSLDPNDTEHNSELAISVMKELGIPILVYQDEIANHSEQIDSKALITQLSAAKVVLDNLKTEIQTTNASETHESIQNTEIADDINQERSASIENTENESVEPSYSNDACEMTESVPTTTSESILDSCETEQRCVIGQEVEGDNSQYAGRKFGLTMILNEDDYNDGNKLKGESSELFFGQKVSYGVTLTHDGNPFQNPAGLKLDLALEPDAEHDVYQQFSFGQNEWNTVIDSVFRQGMVWDVCNADDLNPPDGTPFYLFPFHGRHNQRFVYRDGYIYAKQNGQVVTYVGGDVPFVMMPPTNILKARQTFHLQLL